MAAFAELHEHVEVHLLCAFCRPSGASKALKLGAKGKEVDFFVDKLKSEGEHIITSSTGRKASDASKVLQPPVNTERYSLLFSDHLSNSIYYAYNFATVEKSIF